MITARLTLQNYKKGMLVDPELMAGVAAAAEDSAEKGQFLAFVLNHQTGAYLGAQHFPTIEQALETINQIPRDWKYEATGGCGANGVCDTGNCPGVCSRAEAAAGGADAAASTEICDSKAACESAQRSFDSEPMIDASDFLKDTKAEGQAQER
jgi:hypothetical protein